MILKFGGDPRLTLLCDLSSENGDNELDLTDCSTGCDTLLMNMRHMGSSMLRCNLTAAPLAHSQHRLSQPLHVCACFCVNAQSTQAEGT